MRSHETIKSSELILFAPIADLSAYHSDPGSTTTGRLPAQPEPARMDDWRHSRDASIAP